MADRTDPSTAAVHPLAIRARARSTRCGSRALSATTTVDACIGYRRGPGHDDAGERNSAARSPSRWCRAKQAPYSAAVRHVGVIRGTDLAVVVKLIHGGLPLASNISRTQLGQGRAPESSHTGPLSRRRSEPFTDGRRSRSRRDRTGPVRRYANAPSKPPLRTATRRPSPEDVRLPPFRLRLRTPRPPRNPGPTSGWLSPQARRSVTTEHAAAR